MKRVSDEDRTSLESDLVEEMMSKISKEGKATYGFEKVKKSAEAGAIEKLLVSDELLREEREKIEPLIERARNTGSDVLIISSEHESGSQLARMGGLGAILRYRID